MAQLKVAPGSPWRDLNRSLDIMAWLFLLRSARVTGAWPVDIGDGCSHPIVRPPIVNIVSRGGPLRDRGVEFGSISVIHDRSERKRALVYPVSQLARRSRCALGPGLRRSSNIRGDWALRHVICLDEISDPQSAGPQVVCINERKVGSPQIHARTAQHEHRAPLLDRDAGGCARITHYLSLFDLLIIPHSVHPHKSAGSANCTAGAIVQLVANFITEVAEG